MSTFALLGATGTVGGLVLESILDTTNHRVHCFVRSKSKLMRQISSTSRSDAETRIDIFEGDMTKTDVLQQCIQGTQIAFLCAASTASVPGCRIAQDQAEAVVKALRNIKSENPSARPPKLVVLSSAETEEKWRREMPAVAEFLLFRANSFIYTDLMAAEDYLRNQDDFVTTVFMKPGGLSHDISRGHKLTTETQQTFLSFRDLAAGMVEAAETAVDSDKWDMKSVSVVSPGGKAKIEWTSVPLLLKGLLIHFFPWLYPYIG